MRLVITEVSMQSQKNHKQKQTIPLEEQNNKLFARIDKDGETFKELTATLKLYRETIETQKTLHQTLVDYYEDEIERITKVCNKNYDIAEQNAKSYYEMTRAYNALCEFGKLAEELGIDTKKHNAELPENKYKDFEFDIGQKVGESGKVTSFVSLRNPKTKEEFKIKMQNNEKKPKDPQSQPKVKQEDEPNE